jgi:methylenetetrahydrofolate reductase (NADPH)
MKIINKINEKTKNNEQFYSFEYFPPKTEGGIENLLERIERMALLNPLWVDMTWGAGGTTSESTLFLSSYIQNYINLDILMHITCRCLTKEKIDQALEEVSMMT